MQIHYFKKFERNNAISLYDSHGNALIGLAKNPCPRGREIHNVGGPFLGYYTLILTLSVLCVGKEKKTFKGIMNFTILLIWTRSSIKHLPQGS